MRTLNSLTGLRFLAALSVFFTHAAIHGHEGLFGQGRVGVSFFFVLSGFVLMWSRDEMTAAVTFLRRRFARIYPAYAVAWVAGIGVSVGIGTGNATIGRIVAGAVLLQSWIPDSHWYFAVNGPSWSLSDEAFFYATFPIWAGALALASTRQIRTVAFVCEPRCRG